MCHRCMCAYPSPAAANQICEHHKARLDHVLKLDLNIGKSSQCMVLRAVCACHAFVHGQHVVVSMHRVSSAKSSLQYNLTMQYITTLQYNLTLQYHLTPETKTAESFSPSFSQSAHALQLLMGIKFPFVTICRPGRGGTVHLQRECSMLLVQYHAQVFC